MSVIVDCEYCNGQGGTVVVDYYGGPELADICTACDGNGTIDVAELDDRDAPDPEWGPLDAQTDAEREAVWRQWEVAR